MLEGTHQYQVLILQEWEQTSFWYCRKQFHAEKERSVLGVLGHSRILAISRRPKTAIFIVLTNGLLLTLQPYMVVVPWKLVVTPYILDPVIRHNVSTFHLWSGSPMPFPEARHDIMQSTYIMTIHRWSSASTSTCFLSLVPSSGQKWKKIPVSWFFDGSHSRFSHHLRDDNGEDDHDSRS